jgi:enterochelin esterase-like enzyme
VRAHAGDLVTVTLIRPAAQAKNVTDESDGARVLADVYDNVGKKLHTLSSRRRVGFVAAASGTYRIEASITGTHNGSHTLKLNPPIAPAIRMRGANAQPLETYRSERISRLAQDVEARVTGAVDQFWGEVLKAGGLMVEPVGANIQEPGRRPDDVLVTLFWRETYPTYNVAVWSDRPVGYDLYYMSHVPGTNVWYKTLRVYRGSRFEYMISPNDRVEDRQLTSQRDPLNPLAFFGSVLETPGAPDETWFRRTPPRRGVVEAKRFESQVLKAGFPSWIYTPPGYSAGSGPYPLVILFDGQGYADTIAAPTTLDNLIGERRIRPPVVCFLGNLRQMGGLAPHNEATSDAVATELLPWLRSMYAISSNPRDVVIGGYSAGGMKGSVIALKYPALFGNVLSQSGSFNAPGNTYEQGYTTRLFVQAQRVPVRFYLDVGLYEPGIGSGRAEEESLTVGNRHFRDVLQAKGYEVIYRETGGSHEALHWRATLAEGLLALLGSSD